MLQYQKMVRHEGNHDLFMALEMAVMSLNNYQPLNIHAYGLRGTGKTSVMRSIKNTLPMIKRIKGCPFNCEPTHPTCPFHKDLSADEIQALGTEWITMPMLEISHSAKIGTVVGSIDLYQLTNKTQAQVALLPGTIAQANRGILFIDEINRLADTAPELTDILLDVMGTKPGLLQIEEEGMPKISMPVNISVWAASNPDEDPGPLSSIRKQLSDRFDITVHVKRPSSTEDLIAIILDNMPIDQQKQVDWNKNQRKIQEISIEHQLLHKMATIFIHYDLESMRALKSWYLTSKVHALWQGQPQVTLENIKDAFSLCFEHRLDQNLMKEIRSDLNPQHSSSQENFRNEHQPELKTTAEDKTSKHLLQKFMSRFGNVTPANIKERASQDKANTSSNQDNAVINEPHAGMVSPEHKARRIGTIPPGQRVYHKPGSKNDF